jgi:hypothetical protein
LPHDGPQKVLEQLLLELEKRPTAEPAVQKRRARDEIKEPPAWRIQVLAVFEDVRHAGTEDAMPPGLLLVPRGSM